MASKALFNILYQNDTLYHLPDIAPVKIDIAREAVAEPQPTAIVETTETLQITKKKEATPASVGNFPGLKHDILVLFEDEANLQLADSDAVFLDNILKAVKSTSSSVDIINVSSLGNPDARHVLSEKLTQKFISFGVPFSRLQVDLFLIPYSPKLVDDIWFLSADNLSTIERDKDLKRKLWIALQKMFEKI